MKFLLLPQEAVLVLELLSRQSSWDEEQRDVAGGLQVRLRGTLLAALEGRPDTESLFRSYLQGQQQRIAALQHGPSSPWLDGSVVINDDDPIPYPRGFKSGGHRRKRGKR